MFTLALLTLSLTVSPFMGVAMDSDRQDLVPGDAVGLDSRAPAVLPVKTPTRPSGGGGGGSPLVPSGIVVSAILAASAAAGWKRRRRRSSSPVFVLVHGNGGSSRDFDELLEAMGVDRDDTVDFDYRSVVEAASSADASRVANTEAASRRLDSLIRQVSERSSNIYSLHHSKGGAVGVAMIASLDDGTADPIDGYRGAALLDPAIASGWLGSLQRAGRLARWIPDNGDFDPMRCDDTGCRDMRVNLGERAGVEVIAIRNPDAVITNFTDEPKGLRIYDLIDDGKSSALLAPFGVYGFQKRVREAHQSVLKNSEVADCIAAEVARSGACAWKGDSSRAGRSWGRGNKTTLGGGANVR